MYFHSACGCSAFGSVREDCEQMTGRCVCKSGIQGQKCTVCSNHEHTLGPNGCFDRTYLCILYFIEIEFSCYCRFL